MVRCESPPILLAVALTGGGERETWVIGVEKGGSSFGDCEFWQAQLDLCKHVCSYTDTYIGICIRIHVYVCRRHICIHT